MKLKNFYISDELNKDLKYASKILEKSEGSIIRESINKNFKKLYPKTLTKLDFYSEKLICYIIKKAKHKCSECGKKIFHQIIKDAGYHKTKYERRRLHIHHIDRNPNNNSIPNLKLVCQKCHGKMQKKMVYEKRKD